MQKNINANETRSFFAISITHILGYVQMAKFIPPRTDGAGPVFTLFAKGAPASLYV
jgi:hypothetical protein